MRKIIARAIFLCLKAERNNNNNNNNDDDSKKNVARTSYGRSARASHFGQSLELLFRLEEQRRRTVVFEMLKDAK